MYKGGFGKRKPERKSKASAKPKQPKQTAKKARGKLDEYVLIHHGQDGKVRVLGLMATSQNEASRKFKIFIDTLNLCLSGVSDQELQRFVEENPL